MRLFTRFVAVIAAVGAGVIVLVLMYVAALDESEDWTRARLQISLDSPVNDAALSPDGQQIAVAAGGYCRLHIYETITGREVQQTDLCPDERLWGLSSVSWSHTGERIVVTRVLSGDTWVVEVASQVVVQELIGHPQQVQGAIYSHDGRHIATYGDGVRLWDADSGQSIRDFVDPTHAVTVAVFSRDDRTLATAGSDGVIRLWDVQTGTELVQFSGHESTVFTVAFSDDGLYLASGGIDNTARVWRVEDGSQIQRYENPSWVMQMYFLDDGHVLFSNWLDGGINLWDISTNKIVAQLDAGLESNLVAFNPVQSWISTMRDDKVELWEAPERE